MPGAMFGLAKHHAADRIGFRKTVSWDIADVERVLTGNGPSSLEISDRAALLDKED